jgi:predicted choloylglycine hydrolase
MYLNFRAVDVTSSEDFSTLFAEYWPDYCKWWSKDGVTARPSYLAGLTAIKRYMPEFLPLYKQICEWVGGSDLKARFLSHYRPPAYISACSQAIWTGESPSLVRNYDYNPHAFDSLILKTHWQGRTVLGTSDGLIGLVDGINDLGLSVSLTFGGRPVAGDGFGVPLVLRYVLQTCETAEQASQVLSRIPVHMSYNITVLDAKGHYRTVQMGPDRGSVITHAAVATNHQTGFQWDQQTRFTATVERERYLLQRLTLRVDSEQAFKEAFLRAPLYSTAFAEGFGTLYTAAYKPQCLSMQMLWPGASWTHSVLEFKNSRIRIKVPDAI